MKKIISGMMLLMLAGRLPAFAGDLAVDNLTVVNDTRIMGNLYMGPISGAFPTNQTLYYDFNSDTNPVPDMSGNGKTGTVSGATWVTNGITGGGYCFDGVNDYISAGRLTELEGATNYTISFWVKLTNSSGTRIIFAYDRDNICGNNNTYRDAYLYWSSSASSLKYCPGTGSGENSLSISLSDSTWHHVVLVRTNNTIISYENGVATATFTAMYNATGGSTYKLWLGHPMNVGAFAGFMDEVVIYNRALSASAVVELYYSYVQSSGEGQIFVPSITSSNSISQTSSTATNIFMGRMGIGTNSPGTNVILHVNGNMQTEGDMDVISNLSVDGTINTPAGNMTFDSGTGYGSTMDFRLHGVLNARLSENIMTLYSGAVSPSYVIDAAESAEGYFRNAKDDQMAILQGGTSYGQGGCFVGIGTNYLWLSSIGMPGGSALVWLTYTNSLFAVSDISNSPEPTNRFTVTKDGRVYFGNIQIGDTNGILQSALPPSVVTNGSTASFSSVSGNGSGLTNLSGSALASASVTTAKLDLVDVDARYVNANGDTMTGILQLPTDGLRVNSNQLTMVNGNIGLGTTNPSKKLQVVGDISVADQNGTNKVIISKGTSGGAITVNSSSGVTKVGLFGNTSPSYFLNGLGVGTASAHPSVSLQVVSKGGEHQWPIEVVNTDGNTLYNFYVNNYGSASLWLSATSVVPGYAVSINAGGDSYFNGGNLAVGTNVPSAKLHVNGDIKAEGGISYVVPLGDVGMGVYTNKP
ncbi:MAG: LamG domain-containing protein [Kiritimatiellae bacterium]|nr:LamG domain-containing protein [Kiritimatiellia bacterium]MDD5523358.1 LamG domain-containing protein [Kiritimatiellia bacterium]